MKKRFTILSVTIGILISVLCLCACDTSAAPDNKDGHVHKYKDGVCSECYEIDPKARDTENSLEFEAVTIDGVDGYSVKRVKKDYTGYIKVPDKHDGKPVIALSVFAFSEYGGTSIYVPDSVTYVGYNNTGFSIRYMDVFDHCPELVRVSLPSGLTHVGMSFVNDCPKLKYNEYGNGLYLGNADNPYVVLVKAKSTDITAMDVHGDTKIITDFVTEECFYLSGRLTIPLGVREVGYAAFSYCPGLTIYCEHKERPSTWDEDWHTYDLIFITYTPDSEFIDLAEKVIWDCLNNDKDEDGYAHTNFDGIHYALKDGKATVALQPINVSGDVVLPQTVEYDGKTYPVTAVSAYAFNYCVSLTSVRIPASVTEIGSYVFSECRGVTVYCEIAEKPTGYNSNFTRTFGYAGNYCPPVPVVYDCSNNNADEDGFEYVVSDGTRYKLKDGKAVLARQANERKTDAFSGKVDIPQTVSHGNEEYPVIGIDDYVFYDCKTVTEVNIPDTVVQIGKEAFFDCVELKGISLGSVKELGRDAFAGCSKLKSANLVGLSVLPPSAFSGCESLEFVSFSQALTEIYDWAFWGCVNLSRIDYDGAGWKWRRVQKQRDWKDDDASFTVYCKNGTYNANMTFTEDPDYVCVHDRGEWQFNGSSFEPKHYKYCENCDDIEQADCVLDDGEVTVEPDCENCGTFVYTCTVCGGKINERIPELGHDWSEYSSDDYYHMRECKRCGITEKEWHSLSRWRNDGEVHTRECSVCHAVFSADHAWNEGTVTTPPDGEYDGEMTYTCYTCGATKKEPIPHTGNA